MNKKYEIVKVIEKKVNDKKHFGKAKPQYVTKFAFKDVETGKTNSHTFDEAYFARIILEDSYPTMSFLDDLAHVNVDGKWKLYNIEEDYLFQAECERDFISSYKPIINALKECPEDFAHLPTSCFKEEGFEQIIQHIVKYAHDLNEIVNNKIAKEQENIRLGKIEDELE